jgi:hypothetical protein
MRTLWARGITHAIASPLFATDLDGMVLARRMTIPREKSLTVSYEYRGANGTTTCYALPPLVVIQFDSPKSGK